MLHGHCYECDTALTGPLCLKCNPLAHTRIITDFKLLAAGVGIGALICSTFVGAAAAQACGTIAISSAIVAAALRYFERKSNAR